MRNVYNKLPLLEIIDLRANYVAQFTVETYCFAADRSVFIQATIECYIL